MAKEKKMTRNRMQCTLCKDIIESKFRHDFVTCKCGNLGVDGGLDYFKFSFKFYGKWKDLCEYE